MECVVHSYYCAVTSHIGRNMKQFISGASSTPIMIDALEFECVRSRLVRHASILVWQSLMAL